MIGYDPFRETLKRRGISTYAHISKHGMSGHTVRRVRRGGGISAALIGEPRALPGRRVEDILRYVPDA